MIWDKLNRFTKITKFKSLSEASRKGDISQPTWSRNISELENVFGTRLILRDHNGIRLTNKGKDLLEIVQNFKTNLNDFKFRN